MQDLILKSQFYLLLLYEMRPLKPNKYLIEQHVGIFACTLEEGCSQVQTEGAENVIQSMECHLCRQMCANL